MDSGNYEASHREDNDWTHDKLKQALNNTPHNWAFCFDQYENLEDTNAVIDQVLSAVERDQDYTNSRVLPIVHASQFPDGSFNFKQFPERVYEVAKQISPPLVAIPERELGSGIIERAKTVMKIREYLDELTCYQPLHILGAGNPWAISILAAAGADTFDGLEWCRMVIDHDSGCLHHDQHFDFFNFQGRREDSSILARVLDDPEVNYAGKVAFHNLEFYSQFNKELQETMRSGALEALAGALLGRQNMKVVKKEIPNLFQ